MKDFDIIEGDLKIAREKRDDKDKALVLLEETVGIRKMVN